MLMNILNAYLVYCSVFQFLIWYRKTCMSMQAKNGSRRNNKKFNVPTISFYYRLGHREMKLVFKGRLLFSYKWSAKNDSRNLPSMDNVIIILL